VGSGRQLFSWIAPTGLILVLFLVLHLAGVVLAVIHPEAFEAYATALHAKPWLPAVELALAAVALVHLARTMAKVIANRQAGNDAALVSRRADPLAALAARTAPWSGGVLLVFLVVHLNQLRWPRPGAGLELARLAEVLRAPWLLALYGAAGLAVGLHLFHGGEAAHRSLGLLEPANAVRIRSATRAFALVVGGGFVLVPLVLASQVLR
jgi:succinate dehydrogenase / fumarate reductase cytochrome b subunit